MVHFFSNRHSVFIKIVPSIPIFFAISCYCIDFVFVQMKTVEMLLVMAGIRILLVKKRGLMVKHSALFYFRSSNCDFF